MILVDEFEPAEIYKLIEQSAPVTWMPLNITHRSDYYFGGEDNKTRQFSRKQAGELLSDIDEAERQLSDYYVNADENYQVVEGIISAVPLLKTNKSYNAISIRHQARPTTLFSYKVEATGYMHSEHSHEVSASLLYAWLFRLEQNGVHTFYTENWIGTARMLSAIYKNCQKPPEQHDTMQRYIRPRIVLKEHNPFIFALMAIGRAYKIKIGEATATKIASKYTNILDIAMSTPNELEEVEGIGKTTAVNLLEAIGRSLEEEL